MCMIDDVDPVTLLAREYRTAKKEHECAECRRTIRAKETYLSERFVFEGDFTNYKICSHCEVARKWLMAECGGTVYGGVAEDIREHCTERYYAMDLYRITVSIGKRWARKNGELLPIPTMPKTSLELRESGVR